MKNKIKLLSITSILLLISIVFVVAQPGTVPTIPPTFTVSLGIMPPPLPNQMISICNYTEGIYLKKVQVWSNEPSIQLGQGNITYSFQIGMPHCAKSYYRSFEYSVLSNPVTMIENDLRQTVLTSIHVPQPGIIPISVGSPSASGGSV